ncbi:HDOD domain-containing protein [Opitutus sp. ER46]|uniref:HDOD domain-containing protein n=1 Tax=Opitutus sp. ER46 TaxID=2161864 RepID=UPI001304906A|nr:HDOD domain-containing protein [Opitutus sp. ER46]
MSVDLALTRDHILDHAHSLPAAPRVMASLCDLLQDINTDLDQIAYVIRADPALGARVIRISNSVVYGGDWQVASIDEAVNRVGFEEVLRLVGTASVAGFVDRSLMTYHLEAEHVRASLLLHALASESLARRAGIDPRTAYTAGLLRALGMMVIDRAARGRLAPARTYDNREHATYLDWEVARFGVGAPDVTRMILDEWRFPDPIVNAIALHLLHDETAEADPFAALLNVAGAIVNAASLALPGETRHWELTPRKLQAARLTESQWRAALDEALTRFGRQRAGLVLSLPR